MEKGETALAVHGSTEQFGVQPPTDGAIRITESSVILSVLPAASTTAAAAASTDSGISSAISEEDDVPGTESMGTGSSLAVAAAAKDDADVQTVAVDKVVKEVSSGGQLPLVATAQPPELKLERPKFNAKLKGNFEEVKRIALMIEKAVRHRLL